MLDLGSLPRSPLESMELVRLPSPPYILCRLLDICREPDCSLDDLVELISTDAALTGKLMMAADSSAFAITQPIADIGHAASLVGLDLVKTMVLTASIQQLFAGMMNSQKRFVCSAWLDALYCAEFAKNIAQTLGYTHVQDAYLAGLFHDFGQIIFDTKYHEQYIEILSSENEAQTLHKESMKFGMRHTELGANILEKWSSLSPAIADAARFHHEDEEHLKGCDLLCQIVAEASQLAFHWCRNGRADLKWRSRLISDEDLAAVYVHIQDKITRTAAKLGIPLARYGGFTQDQFAKDLDKDTFQLARRIRDASLINVISPQQAQVTVLESPRNLLLKLSREMQLFFSVSDLALLMPDADNPNLLTLYEVGYPQAVSQFAADNSNSNIIKSYTEKRNVWIEPNQGRDEIFPISDRQIIRRLNHEIAFSLPLGHGDRVVGAVIIGADEAQKRNLENLSKFILGYLKNITNIWLKDSRELDQKHFEESMRREETQTDIDKLAHEIANPLSVIGNYINIIEGGNKAAAANRKEFRILKEELTRIENIVLNFKESKRFADQSVLLNNELASCVPIYVKSISNDQQVLVNWELDEIDAKVDISRDALRQIVLNLVKNAIEAQSVNAEILVSSRHFVNFDGQPFAQFSIADRGRGVDSFTRRQLFSPLSSTKEGAGRGLGLAVVSETLNSFNGQIKYMENEFGGASFEVLIPLPLAH